MSKAVSGMIIIIGMILVVDVMIKFQGSLIPFTMALMLALMLMPLVNFLERYLYLPRMMASVLIISLLLWAFYPISRIIFSSLSQFIDRIGVYESQLNIIISELADRFNIDISLVDGSFSVRTWLLNWISNKTAWLVGGANKFLAIASKIFIILFFSLFVLNERTLILRKLNSLLSGSNSQLVNETITVITNKIGRYLLLKTIVSLATGLLIYFTMRLFGVEAPRTWGFFAFILNFIPNIGSLLISLLIGIMALIQFYPNWNIIVVISLVVVAIQMIVGNVIDPKLQGDQLDLSPLVILIALLFWGAVWGLEGMFLAVPLTEIIKIICSNTNSLRAVSVFITSGRSLPRLADEPVSLFSRFIRKRRYRKGKKC